MQSSATVMFRALVMLGCLVAIPLAAVLGTSLPDTVKRLLDVRWPGIGISSRAASSEAPQFIPTAGSDLAPLATSQPPRSEANPFATQGNLPPSGETTGQPTPMVVPAGYETEMSPGRGMPNPGRPTTPVSSAGSCDSRPQPAASNPAGDCGPAAVDQFIYVQDRLRQLGATYYLLESWGSAQRLYRFYCKMAVGGNPNYTRYFENTNSDPLQAMTQVLQQVESWRAGSQ